MSAHDRSPLEDPELLFQRGQRWHIKGDTDRWYLDTWRRSDDSKRLFVTLTREVPMPSPAPRLAATPEPLPPFENHWERKLPEATGPREWGALFSLAQGLGVPADAKVYVRDERPGHRVTFSWTTDPLESYTIPWSPTDYVRETGRWLWDHIKATAWFLIHRKEDR